MVDLESISSRMDALEDAVEADILARSESAAERYETIEKALAELKAMLEAKEAKSDAIAALTAAVKAIKPPVVTVAAPAVQNTVDVPPAQVVVQPSPAPARSFKVEFHYSHGRISGATIKREE